MQLIDTHNHVYLPDFDTDRDVVIARAVASGVTSILMPNIDSSTVAPMMEVAERFRDICLPMMGLHPTSVKEDYKKELKLMHVLLGDNSYCGIGETGIDLYWDKTYVKEQIIAFREHLTVAEEMKLPVIIHARESLELIFKELESYGTGKVTGIFHAFPGNASDARRAVDMGFMIGIGGVVTFRNSSAGEAAMAAGLENIVLETDAPYLTPVPHRGKRNESAYLTYIAGKLAEIFSVEPGEIGLKTSSNACRIFKLK
jgi:TatD DNase family protein